MAIATASARFEAPSFSYTSFRCCLRNPQHERDVVVGESPRDGIQDLHLTFRESLVVRAVAERLADLGREMLDAARRIANGAGKLVVRQVLRHGPDRAGGHGPGEIGRCAERGQDQNLRCRGNLEHGGRRLGAVHARQAEIHHDHVRLQFGRKPYGRLAVLRLAADLEVGLEVDDCR